MDHLPTSLHLSGGTSTRCFGQLCDFFTPSPGNPVDWKSPNPRQVRHHVCLLPHGFCCEIHWVVFFFLLKLWRRLLVAIFWVNVTQQEKGNCSKEIRIIFQPILFEGVFSIFFVLEVSFCLRLALWKGPIFFNPDTPWETTMTM